MERRENTQKKMEPPFWIVSFDCKRTKISLLFFFFCLLIGERDASFFLLSIGFYFHLFSFFFFRFSLFRMQRIPISRAGRRKKKIIFLEKKTKQMKYDLLFTDLRAFYQLRYLVLLGFYHVFYSIGLCFTSMTWFYLLLPGFT